tara:strand:+ start:401 stop:1624 length:1224 start_codon:yes stop_codon:yes gene_type:complete
MKIKNCRICNSKNFFDLFSLGKLSFTGKFPKNLRNRIPKDFVSLIMCKKCKLVQLDRNFNPNYLYSQDYGYRTGINSTMTKHVQLVVKEATRLSKLNKKDHVLDIASNDGTLLNFYDKKFVTVGIDPLIKKYKNFYKKINFKVSNFFSFRILKKQKLNFKFKVITALSMFYDLKKPNVFVGDIKKILHKDGIFILEHADLLSLFKYTLFDTICHEHLEYYSSKIIIDLMKKNKMRVFDIKNNDINGGSSRYFICHNNAKFKINKKKINNILKEEKKLKLEDKNSYYKFYKKINFIRNKTNKLIDNLADKNKIIHGYGASTKGNVFLQYLGISSKKIPFIAERNPLKFNKFTPGNYIKIISEKKSRLLKPDYYLVLPWHFKKEILKRETKIRKAGTKFIFPLPALKIV